MNINNSLYLAGFSGILRLPEAEMVKQSELSASFESLSVVDDCLVRNDCDTILLDKDLFWLAFCKALASNKDREVRCRFEVSLHQNSVKIWGSDDLIEKTQCFVEELRLFFLDSSKNRLDFEVFAVKDCGCCHLLKESPIFDLSQVNDSEYSYLWYSSLIKPALPELARFCGAVYSEEHKKITVRTSDYTQVENCEAIQVNWLAERPLVYLIPPKNIPVQIPNQDIGSQPCDFILSSADKQTNIHSSVLLLNAGPVIQKMLSTQMKEAEEHMIMFSEYSQDTVDNFIQFLYHGGQSLLSYNQEISHLVELFEFANTYQIEALIDCCTNLFCAFATQDDLEILTDLVDKYDNNHLKLLLDHLAPKDLNLS